MFNKHPKRKMAMKMMTNQEKKFGITVFDSFAWLDRKRIIKQRIMKTQ